MNWREESIQEYRAALEHKESERRQQERQKENERIQVFRGLLRELLRVDVEPAGLEATIDGITFGLFSAPAPYDQAHPSVVKVAYACTRCGEKLWSPPIPSRLALGEWLYKQSRPEHPCRLEQEQYLTQPWPAPKGDGVADTSLPKGIHPRRHVTGHGSRHACGRDLPAATLG